MTGLAILHSNVTDYALGNELRLHVLQDFTYRKNNLATCEHGVPVNPNNQLLVVTTRSGSMYYVHWHDSY